MNGAGSIDLPELSDRPYEHSVGRNQTLYTGRKFGLDVDVVELPDGDVTREYLTHPGAVAVIALDDADRVLLVSQYRHPVRAVLWELPAGLRDEADEPALRTAQRELAEEADVAATQWWHLVDFMSSPGCSTEVVSIFLARGITVVPEPERHERTAEERDLVSQWFDLDAVADAVLARRLRNPTLVTGVLAALAARSRGWRQIDPA